MSRAIRSAVILGMLALTFVLVTGAAHADAPSGPRLAYTRDDYSPAGEELLTTDPLAIDSLLLQSRPDAHRTLQHLTWSGNGARLAFASHGAGLGERIYTVSPAGGSLREVSGTQFGFSPVFSRDGGTIAFALRFFAEPEGEPYDPFISVSIWLVDSQGDESRRLTPRRDGLQLVPSSFSPDGTSLLAESLSDEEEPGPPEIVSVPLDGRSPSLVIEEGAEPAYSPDGKRIAFVRPQETSRITPIDISPVTGGDLFVIDSDGSDLTQLTFTPGRLEVRPNWDPSGERIAFVRSPAKPTPAAQRRRTGSSIMEINADGSCGRRILFTRGVAYREAVWQPGPGREAGRIPC